MIMSPFDLGSFKGGIKAVEFYKVLQKIKEPELELLSNETEYILKANNVEIEFTKLANEQEQLLENLLVLKDLEWHKLPDNFMTILKMGLLSNNNSKFKGVVVEKGIIYSTDRKRVIKANLHKEDFIEEPIWLNESTVQSLLKLKSFTEFSINKQQIYFKDEKGLLLISKLLDIALFPIEPLKNIIKSYDITKLKWITLPDELVDAVDRANVFYEKDNSNYHMSLKFSKNRIVVLGEQERAKYKEIIKWKCEDIQEEVSILIEPSLFKNALLQYVEFSLSSFTENSENVVGFFRSGNDYLMIVSVKS